MFEEFDKVIKCLALELPVTVWKDVNLKYQALKTNMMKELNKVKKELLNENN